jgi:outer membrane protein TolC
MLVAQSPELPELDRYIGEALGSNLKIRQTLEVIREKQAAKDEARAGFYPRLNFDARYSRAGGGREISIDPSRLLQGSLPPGIELGDPVTVNFMREKEHDTHFSLSQPLFTAGMIKSSYLAGNMDLEAARAELEAVRESIVYEVSKAYLSYLMTIRLEKIANENLTLAEEHLRVAQKLYEAEKAPLNDIYRAEVQVSSVRQAVSESRTSKKLAALYFNKLLDLDAHHSIRIPPETNDSVELVPDKELGLSLDECLNLAADNRAELRQLRFNLKALDYLKNVYRAQFYPHLSLGATYGWEGEKYKFDARHDYWNLSLMLSLNIFDGGSRKARIRQAEAQKSRIDYLYTDILRSISLEASEAFYRLENLMVKRQSARDQLKSARENFRITGVQYENDLASQILYLDAQNAYTTAKANLIIVYYEILIAGAALDKASGIGLTKYTNPD